MRLENLKNEFPKMPERMQEMVEREVEKQVKKVRPHFSTKKTAAVAIVAVMALGTTVFAGAQISKMYGTSAGKYGIVTKIKNEETQTSDAGTVKNIDIPKVAMKFGYLPEGLKERDDDGKFDLNGSSQSGVSIVLYRMDKGDDAFKVLDTNVLKKEELKVGEHDAEYLEVTKAPDESNSFNQSLYVHYPEKHYVMEMYATEDIPKAEVLKMAAGITLENSDKQDLRVEDWSVFEQTMIENQKSRGVERIAKNTSIKKSKMKNHHKIGDTVTVGAAAWEGKNKADQTMDVTVKDVQIKDNINNLDTRYMEDAESFAKIADKNGKLLPNKINYVKYGDGVQSIDQIVKTRNVTQKLVYVTLEYKNTGNKEIKEGLYWGNLLAAKENTDSYDIYEETPGENEDWDEAVNTSPVNDREMVYYDVRGGGKGVNHINSLKPGETKTIHIAFVVNEDILPYMYLNLDGEGGMYEFSDSMLKVGLFDIRQK